MRKLSASIKTFRMAVIVTPQCYYEALGKGFIEPGFGRFLMQYLTFQDFPGDAWGGEEPRGEVRVRFWPRLCENPATNSPQKSLSKPTRDATSLLTRRWHPVSKQLDL